MRSIKWALLSLGLLVLGACQPAGPLRQITTGNQLARYDFSEPESFEEGSYGAAALRIENGVYTIEVFEGDNALWWGQWGDDYEDVVVDVDVEQVTERNENAYGVMCRVQGGVGQGGDADPEMAALLEDTTPIPEVTAEVTAARSEATDEADATPEATVEATEVSTSEATAEATLDVSGIDVADEDATPEATAETSESGPRITAGDGYLFLIQGNGQFAIVRARGRNLSMLVDWRQSDAIHQGIGRNHLRAVCVEDYLAFYINDKFVADTTDGTFATGQVGMAASAASRLGTEIEFDNLSVSAPNSAS